MEQYFFFLWFDVQPGYLHKSVLVSLDLTLIAI